MPRIFVLTGADVGHQSEIDGGAVFGRAEECAVQLKDASISRRHAELRKTAEGFEVVDLGSRNGISYDGARVERCLLKNRDEFTLGNVKIRFIQNEAPAAVEEIELESPAADVAAKPETVAAKPQAPVASGAARKRALAQREGILQFDRIDDAAPSILTDEIGQHGMFTKILVTIGLLLVVAGIFYGVMLLSGKLTPEPKNVPETTSEEEK